MARTRARFGHTRCRAGPVWARARPRRATTVLLLCGEVHEPDLATWCGGAGGTRAEAHAARAPQEATEEQEEEESGARWTKSKRR